jgi:DNA-binding CsgD family transcriptional regulator
VTSIRDLRGAAPMLLVSGVVVLVAFGLARGIWLSNLHNGLLGLAFTFVGAYVLYQRPRHRIGELFMATGVVEAVMFLGRQIAHTSTSDTSQWWGWLGVWPVAIGIALTTLSVIFFPDGRLPSPRWRWVVVAVVGVAAVCAALSAIWPVEYASTGVVAQHPLDPPGGKAAATIWSAVAHPAYAVSQSLWLVAVVLRWRSSGRHVRRQLAALGPPVALSVMALLVGVAVWNTPTPGALTAALVPVAAGWAIVHGQHLTAYSALSWLSRTGPRSQDRPTELAEVVAEALAAPGATVWIGAEDRLHAVGVWPESENDIEPTSAAALRESSTQHLRLVRRKGSTLGALTVRRPATDRLGLAEARLLDDLTAQAALVIEHLSLAEIVDQQRRSGHLDQLSPRENEVLELMARGLSNAAICEQLHLSIKTVEPVVSAIFSKLGLYPASSSNRRVLAVLAYLRT